MSVTLNLPRCDRRQQTVILQAAPVREKLTGTNGDQHWNRTAFAAAHVVADPLADHSPWIDTALDWDATMAFREHLWGLGLGVAEAMDTAQRGMGLNWPTSLELIQRSADAARAGQHRIASGVGTDHLSLDDALTLDDVMRAYDEQLEAVEAAGSGVIIMASRALARVARGAEDYQRVYAHVLDNLAEPAILHWLGEMFDPALAGYWGSEHTELAMETCLSIIEAHAGKVDGIKISLLSAEKEISMRRRLPDGVKMYTGDDFNYPELIAGDEYGYSHALLGIFDPIAPTAARAFDALARDDETRFHQIFDSTVPLARHIFAAPTRYYKTGVVFLAYLCGHQNHFTMVGGQQSARSAVHLADIVRLANEAGLFVDPDEAARRARCVFAAQGILV